MVILQSELGYHFFYYCRAISSVKSTVLLNHKKTSKTLTNICYGLLKAALHHLHTSTNIAI